MSTLTCYWRSLLDSSSFPLLLHVENWQNENQKFQNHHFASNFISDTGKIFLWTATNSFKWRSWHTSSSVVRNNSRGTKIHRIFSSTKLRSKMWKLNFGSGSTMSSIPEIYYLHLWLTRKGFMVVEIEYFIYFLSFPHKKHFFYSLQYYSTHTHYFFFSLSIYLKNKNKSLHRKLIKINIKIILKIMKK